MSGSENLGEVCPECKTFAADEHMVGYRDRRICVSCRVTLKLKRGEYAEGPEE